MGWHSRGRGFDSPRLHSCVSRWKSRSEGLKKIWAGTQRGQGQGLGKGDPGGATSEPRGGGDSVPERFGWWQFWWQLRVALGRRASKPIEAAADARSVTLRANRAGTPAYSGSSSVGGKALIIPRSPVRSRAPPLPDSCAASSTPTPPAAATRDRPERPAILPLILRSPKSGRFNAAPPPADAPVRGAHSAASSRASCARAAPGRCADRHRPSRAARRTCGAGHANGSCRSSPCTALA